MAEWSEREGDAARCGVRALTASSFSIPATDRLKASLSDRYHIERELCSGAMATVYLARDLKHDPDVAPKVLRAGLSAVIGTKVVR